MSGVDKGGSHETPLRLRLVRFVPDAELTL